MAGKAKLGSKRKGRGRPAGQASRPIVSRSSRAGLIFPVGRLASKFRKGRYALRYGSGGAVFMAATLEYLTMEILDLAGQCADEHKKKTITPRHICLAIRNDEELNKMFATAQISEGGVRPNLEAVLWAKGKK